MPNRKAKVVTWQQARKKMMRAMKRANFSDQIFRKLRYKNPAHSLLNLAITAQGKSR